MSDRFRALAFLSSKADEFECANLRQRLRRLGDTIAFVQRINQYSEDFLPYRYKPTPFHGVPQGFRLETSPFMAYNGAIGDSNEQKSKKSTDE